MNPQLANRILIALSILYGLAVAAFGAFDSGATGNVAVIGAIILGALWVLRGLFIRGSSSS